MKWIFNFYQKKKSNELLENSLFGEEKKLDNRSRFLESKSRQRRETTICRAAALHPLRVGFLEWRIRYWFGLASVIGLFESSTTLCDLKKHFCCWRPHHSGSFSFKTRELNLWFYFNPIQKHQILISWAQRVVSLGPPQCFDVAGTVPDA